MAVVFLIQSLNGDILRGYIGFGRFSGQRLYLLTINLAIELDTSAGNTWQVKLDRPLPISGGVANL